MEHIGTQTITTERLTLRRFTAADVPAVFKNWAADEKVQHRYAEPVYPTVDAVEGLLEKYIAAYESPDTYRWAVCLDDECIGQIAYFAVNVKNHFAEIEYCIGREFQNKGYITEAVKAVMAYGFDKIKLHKVQICHNALNMPSKRVIEKCGFVYEGTLRDYFFMDGEYVDRLYYSVLESEWKG